MGQLTAFEHALLVKFEALATVSDSALNASESTSKRLQDLSGAMRTRLEKIEEKQRKIEYYQENLLKVLNEQSELTENLLKQMDTLRSASET